MLHSHHYMLPFEMGKRLRVLILLAAVFHNAQAIPWTGPQRTHSGSDGIKLQPPRPTDPAQLLRRISNEQPDTCAYAGGDFYQPLTCQMGNVCGYDIAFDWWGCCVGATTAANGSIEGSTDCNIRTSCMDLVDASSSQCGSTCLSDTMVLACTDTRFQFCATALLVENGTTPQLTLFGCISTTVEGAMLFYQEPLSGIVGDADIPDPNFDLTSLFVNATSSSTTDDSSQFGGVSILGEPNYPDGTPSIIVGSSITQILSSTEILSSSPEPIEGTITSIITSSLIIQKLSLTELQSWGLMSVETAVADTITGSSIIQTSSSTKTVSLSSEPVETTITSTVAPTAKTTHSSSVSFREIYKKQGTLLGNLLLFQLVLYWVIFVV